jgi:hypothetical protein
VAQARLDMAQRLSETTEFSIPLKSIVGMLVAVGLGTGAYFEAMERISKVEHEFQMIQMSVKANSEFRIRWPRGELGSLPADAKQDLLIEGLERKTDRLEKRLERVDDLQVRTKLIEQRLEVPAKK